MARCLVSLAVLVLLVFNSIVLAANSNESENQSSWDRDADGGGVPAQQIPGLRPGSFRYHTGNGFFFHRQRAASGRVFLRCVNYRSNPPCAVRAVMNLDLSDFIVTAGQHNHGPDNQHEEVQQLRNSLFQACRVRPNVRVDLLYHDVCRNVPRDVSSRVSLLSIRPSMVRIQGENRPNIPHSFEELDEVLRNHEEFSRTLDSEADLYHGMVGEVGHRSLLFMSRRILDGAGEIRHIFGDATFFARPNLPESSQLYTIVTVRDNHVLPLGYALMESRSATGYRSLFRFVRQIAPQLDPDFIMTDFELAQQNSFLEVFPRARLTGCLWHYSRAVCRNVRSLGLCALVRDNVNARRILRLSLAIPLAPPDRLLEALNEVVIESRRLNLHATFLNFFHYIRAAWVEGVGSRVLSVFGVRHRTNNVAECHHRNINSRVVRRPNIWRFVEMLREMEDTAWRDLGRLEQGLAPSRARRSTSLLNDARIRSCSRQVIHREMDILHFLSSVSWHLENTMHDLLRERDDEDRPNSPERGPPNQISDNIRLAQDNQRNLQTQYVNDFEVDEEFLSNDPSTHGNSSCDASALFDDLMEDRNENDGSSRGRGRRGAGRRGSRGRGRGLGAVGVSSTGQGRRSLPSQSALSTQSTNDRRSLPTQHAQSREDRRSLPHQRPELILRPEEFSDSEDCNDNTEEGSHWEECIICNNRRGHYAMLGCGVYPICGYCIQQWFIRLNHNNCPHCGCINPGWVRLDIN